MRHPAHARSRAIIGALALALPMALVSEAGSADNTTADRSCTCPELRKLPMPGGDAASVQPLNDRDAAATLHALHVGLTEVPDGANFVWRRSHGRLSGVVRPLFSFKKTNGDVCRHIVVTLRSVEHTRTIEGAACRQPDGRWVLEG